MATLFSTLANLTSRTFNLAADVAGKTLDGIDWTTTTVFDTIEATPGVVGSIVDLPKNAVVEMHVAEGMDRKDAEAAAEIAMNISFDESMDKLAKLLGEAMADAEKVEASKFVGPLLPAPTK